MGLEGDLFGGDREESGFWRVAELEVGFEFHFDAEAIAGDGIGDDGAHHAAVDFKESVGHCLEDQSLTREDDSFKIPAWNVSDTGDLDLAGSIYVATEGGFLDVGGQWVKDLRHCSISCGEVIRICVETNIPRSPAL
jgi:hypothetical protein